MGMYSKIEKFLALHSVGIRLNGLNAFLKWPIHLVFSIRYQILMTIAIWLSYSEVLRMYRYRFEFFTSVHLSNWTRNEREKNIFIGPRCAHVLAESMQKNLSKSKNHFQNGRRAFSRRRFSLTNEIASNDKGEMKKEELTRFENCQNVTIIFPRGWVQKFFEPEDSLVQFSS